MYALHVECTHYMWHIEITWGGRSLVQEKTTVHCKTKFIASKPDPCEDIN